MYDKNINKRLFNKLLEQVISKNINGANNLISKILFNLYIYDLIKKLVIETYDILVYADALYVLAEGYNQLINTLKFIDEWIRLNRININKKKVKL